MHQLSLKQGIVMWGRSRPGLANREHREDSQWAGLFLGLEGRGVIMPVPIGCLHSQQPHSFYLLFLAAPLAESSLQVNDRVSNRSIAYNTESSLI